MREPCVSCILAEILYESNKYYTLKLVHVAGVSFMTTLGGEKGGLDWNDFLGQ